MNSCIWCGNPEALETSQGWICKNDLVKYLKSLLPGDAANFLMAEAQFELQKEIQAERKQQRAGA